MYSFSYKKLLKIQWLKTIPIDYLTGSMARSPGTTQLGPLLRVSQGCKVLDGPCSHLEARLGKDLIRSHLGHWKNSLPVVVEWGPQVPEAACPCRVAQFTSRTLACLRPSGASVSSAKAQVLLTSGRPRIVSLLVISETAIEDLQNHTCKIPLILPYNIIVGVVFHHFCYILWLETKSQVLSSVEITQDWLTGGHHIMCLIEWVHVDR